MEALGSPTHQLARELARILSPLAGKSTSHVRNSADFVYQIHQVSLEETDVMASFDVISLFTRVPVDEALLVISKRLQQDDTLKDRTSIPTPNLCVLVELCLKSTYFQFGKSYYEQVEGAAVGSPLSPISSWKTLRHGLWRLLPGNQRCGVDMLMMSLSSGPTETNYCRNFNNTSANKISQSSLP